MRPLIIFCSDPLEPRHADQAFAAEAGAAERLGVNQALVDFEALVYEHDARAAVRRIAAHADATTGIYRGWMLKPDQYASLYDALRARGVALINDPAAYRHCHYLPESYAMIEGRTPQSVWLKLSRNASSDRGAGRRSTLARPCECPIRSGPPPLAVILG